MRVGVVVDQFEVEVAPVRQNENRRIPGQLVGRNPDLGAHPPVRNLDRVGEATITNQSAQGRPILLVQTDLAYQTGQFPFGGRHRPHLPIPIFTRATGNCELHALR